MIRFSISKGTLFIFGIFLIGCARESSIYNTQKLPNIIFILADDIGYGDLGCYGGKIPTPNLDKLASDGILFTDAHSPAALCAPSRFSMLTGSYPYRAYRAGGAWNISSPSIFSDPKGHTDAGRKITVGEVLQQAGYRTSFFGKSHLGGDAVDTLGNIIRKERDISSMDLGKEIQNSINEIGFEYSYFLPSGIQHAPFAFFENGFFAPFDSTRPADNRSARMWLNGRYEMENGVSQIVEHAKQPGIGDIDYNSSQTGIMLVEKAIGFIDSHIEQNNTNEEDKPFLVYFASQAIHRPHTTPNDFDGDDSELNHPVNGVTGGATSDFIYELDMQVGKLLQKLEDEGVAENTLVFFTSDNGALWPRICEYGDPEHDSNGPLRDYKASVYEGGHRVPFVIKWPGIIEPGQVSDEPVLAQDWVATMYEITNQDMQEDQAMDCTSLLPILTGTKSDDAPVHPFIIYQAGFAYDGAIREGDWVLMVNRDNQATELYDLANDLAQEQNLIDQDENQELIVQLRDKFLTYNDHNDNTLDPRTTKAFKAK